MTIMTQNRLTSKSVPCCAPSEPAPCVKCSPVAVGFPGDLVDPWDAEAPPELWPDDCDDFIWELGTDPEPIGDDDHLWNVAPSEPSAEGMADYRDATAEMAAREHLDASETMTLAELVDRQAAFFESWGNPAGRMLAAAMAELAIKVRLTDATTPAELEARLEVLDADIRSDWEARGYDAAMSQLNGQAIGTFGHMA
jgi:hypothetical protein